MTIYIGETERSLKATFQEHNRRKVDLDTVKILDVEPRLFERGVKEAIHIRVNRPSPNRNGGRYQLPSVWNNILNKRVGRGGTFLTQVLFSHVKYYIKNFW